jgi:hypothetical protein
MNKDKNKDFTREITDSRDAKTILDIDNQWGGNTPATLRRVNQILNKPNFDYQEKKNHGLNWERFNESTHEMPRSFSVSGNVDGTTANYRNPEKKLIPGVVDSHPIFSKVTYQQGVHIFQFDLKCVSPIVRNSHLHIYIGIDCQKEEKDDTKQLTCRWWLSLTKTMLLQITKPNIQGTSILQYPLFLLDIPDTVLMVLDMDLGTVGFIADNTYLGPAFGRLRGFKVNPTINYYGNVDCDITMEYLGCYHNPKTLKKISGTFLRQIVIKNRISKQDLDKLDLPESLTKYVNNELICS